LQQIIGNNNKNTLNHYASFVLYSGQYKPNKYVTGVSNTGIVSESTAFPTSWPTNNAVSGENNINTMYFVYSFGESGLFFLGMNALQQYVCWVDLNLGVTGLPTDAIVANRINALATTSGSTQADLQAYYQSRCFYRGWIRDSGGTTAANKILIRRNHIYYISVTEIKGPGIGNPIDNIDPNPGLSADTYATAQIRIMNWHIVHQPMSNGLD
jgi:hypothetical protein